MLSDVGAGSLLDLSVAAAIGPEHGQAVGTDDLVDGSDWGSRDGDERGVVVGSREGLLAVECFACLGRVGRLNRGG